jgi:RNA polymerase sigma factor (sigma-70 family)
MGHIPSEESEHSISCWLAGLKAGEVAAAEQLWRRYVHRLTELARRALQGAPKTGGDEDDIAQSVFRNVCRGAVEGRFDDLHNRDDLWWLLLSITRQKAIDHLRRETALKRGGGKVVREADLAANLSHDGPFSLESLVGEDPTPEFLVILEEQTQRLLNILRDDVLRRIAIARIEGFSVPEISRMLTISTRSVERKLKLIRNCWLEDPDSRP